MPDTYVSFKTLFIYNMRYAINHEPQRKEVRSGRPLKTRTVSDRMNRIMFLLSMISSIFISRDKTREYKHQNRYCRFLLNSSAREVAIFSRTKFHVTGMEKVPKDTPFLLVCNHRSKLDPIYTWMIFKKYKLSFITKKENFSIPWYGKLIRKCCFLGIDRQDPRKAISTIEKAADLLKRGEVSIGVYPEGTRHLDCKMGEFHALVFRIATDAKVPIVVMAITGIENVAKNFPWKRAHVHMDVLDVYTADEVAAVPRVKLCEKAYNQIKSFIDTKEMER